MVVGGCVLIELKAIVRVIYNLIMIPFDRIASLVIGLKLRINLWLIIAYLLEGLFRI